MSPRAWQILAGLGLAAVLGTALVAPAKAPPPFSVRCPSAGLFVGADEIHGLPNPARGWEIFIDGRAGLIEMQRNEKTRAWHVTCLIRVPPHGNIEASLILPGDRACKFFPMNGAIASDCVGSRVSATACEIRCAVN